MEIQKESITLNVEKQFNWLREIIYYRAYSSISCDFKTLLEQISLPILSLEDKTGRLFSAIIKEYELTPAEQLVLLLSISPYYIPSFFSNNLNAEDKQIHLGTKLLLTKSLVSNTYLPTIDTALLLLSGEDVSARQE